MVPGQSIICTLVKSALAPTVVSVLKLDNDQLNYMAASPAQCRHLLNHARFTYLHDTNRTVLRVSRSTSENASITYLISSSVFHAPSENRTEQ